mmetsp:Transcript_16828/g.53829  ORF Transcript_16828/g.53829 Transcript_16828/m.53829 type:complete len:310 (+) Transcript_16828:424-1353(+)
MGCRRRRRTCLILRLHLRLILHLLVRLSLCLRRRRRPRAPSPLGEQIDRLEGRHDHCVGQARHLLQRTHTQRHSVLHQSQRRLGRSDHRICVHVWARARRAAILLGPSLLLLRTWCDRVQKVAHQLHRRACHVHHDVARIAKAHDDSLSHVCAHFKHHARQATCIIRLRLCLRRRRRSRDGRSAFTPRRGAIVRHSFARPRTQMRMLLRRFHRRPCPVPQTRDVRQCWQRRQRAAAHHITHGPAGHIRDQQRQAKHQEDTSARLHHVHPRERLLRLWAVRGRSAARPAQSRTHTGRDVVRCASHTRARE